MPSGKVSKRIRREFMANQPHNSPIQNLPQQNSNSKLIVNEKSEMYIGPLPDPEMLERYKNAGPDFPERIMRMAEEHNKADVTAKKTISFGNLIIPIFGQVFTLFLGIGGILACIYLARSGFTGGAIATVFVSFSPIIINALRGLRQKNK